MTAECSRKRRAITWLLWTWTLRRTSDTVSNMFVTRCGCVFARKRTLIRVTLSVLSPLLLLLLWLFVCVDCQAKELKIITNTNKLVPCPTRCPCSGLHLMISFIAIIARAGKFCLSHLSRRRQSESGSPRPSSDRNLVRPIKTVSQTNRAHHLTVLCGARARRLGNHNGYICVVETQTQTETVQQCCSLAQATGCLTSHCCEAVSACVRACDICARSLGTLTHRWLAGWLLLQHAPLLAKWASGALAQQCRLARY